MSRSRTRLVLLARSASARFLVPEGGITSEPENIVELRWNMDVAHPAGGVTFAMDTGGHCDRHFQRVWAVYHR